MGVRTDPKPAFDRHVPPKTSPPSREHFQPGATCLHASCCYRARRSILKTAQGGHDFSLPPPLKRCDGRGRRPLYVRINTPPRRIQTPPLNCLEAQKPTPTTRSLMSRPALNTTPAELLRPALYLNEARRRARIAPLRRSPVSSSTIFSTLPMASE